MRVDSAPRADFQQAADTLKPLIRRGDFIYATRATCGAKQRRYVFSGWDGIWICSASCNDIDPRSVTAINGKKVDQSNTLIETPL